MYNNSTFGGQPFQTQGSDLAVTDKINPGILFEPISTEVSGVTCVVRELSGSLYILKNADYNGAMFYQLNATYASSAHVFLSSGQEQLWTAPANSPTPIVWTVSTLLTTPLPAGSVTASELAAGAALGNIGFGGVTAGYLGTGAVVSGNIAANAVTTGDIAAGAVSSTNLAAGAALANIGAAGITSTYLAAGTALANLATQSITSGYISPAQALTQIGWYSVMDFGATGNGTTDDAAAINSCLTAASAAAATNNTLAVVWFPEGNYSVTSTPLVTYNNVVMLTLGATIKGTTNPLVSCTQANSLYTHFGMVIDGFTIIPYGASNAGVAISAPNWNSSYYNGPTIRNCNFAGSPSNSGYLLSILNVSAMSVLNCKFTCPSGSLGGGTGTYVTSASQLQFINCYWENMTTGVQQLSSGIDVVQGVSYQNCFFQSCNTCINSNSCVNWFLVNCQLANNQFLVQSVNDGLVQFVGNFFAGYGDGGGGVGTRTWISFDSTGSTNAGPYIYANNTHLPAGGGFSCFVTVNPSGGTSSYGFTATGNDFFSPGTPFANSIIINKHSPYHIVGNSFRSAPASSGLQVKVNNPVTPTAFYAAAIRHNVGLNPIGNLASTSLNLTPAIPGSGTAIYNTTGYDAVVTITGGTGVSLAVGGSAQGGTTTVLSGAGTYPVPAGMEIVLTYSTAPTWVWMGN